MTIKGRPRSVNKIGDDQEMIINIKSNFERV